MSNLVIRDDVRALASPAMLEAVDALRENLATVENPQLPKIHFKDGFTMNEGEKTIYEFNGIILFAKNQNAFYLKPYNPSNTQPPDCFSPDGITPTQGVAIQAQSCVANLQPDGTRKLCPHNEFGSSPTGNGKRCKNMKVIYLVQEGEILPRVVTIPPTSLEAVNKYFGSLSSKPYWKVLTKFEAYKKDAKQTHYNIKLVKVSDLNEVQSNDAKFVRSVWEEFMRKTPELKVDQEAVPVYKTVSENKKRN